MTSFLGWVVLVLPVILGIVLVFMPDAAKDALMHKRWKVGLLVITVLYSGLVWWWQFRSKREATIDRDHAIEETSRRVARETTTAVTEAMGRHYGALISTMTKQNNALAKQVEEQSKTIEAIGKSDIVTGKQPIPVKVINPTPADAQLEFHAVRIPATPNPKYGKRAVGLLLTTNKRMVGGRVMVRCKNKINHGEARLAGAGVLMVSGGGMQDDNTYLSGITSPDWSPSFPLVVTLYFDSDDIGMCNIRPLK